jgi:hypothetical protein
MDKKKNARDKYDFGKTVKEKDYSPQLKALIEKNRPKDEKVKINAFS